MQCWLWITAGYSHLPSCRSMENFCLSSQELLAGMTEERGCPYTVKPGHTNSSMELGHITSTEGHLAKKIPSLHMTIARFSGTLWTLPLSATKQRLLWKRLPKFPPHTYCWDSPVIYKVFWDVSFLHHCFSFSVFFSLYKHPLWHFKYSEDWRSLIYN